jgi:hypothetical protein
VVLTALTVFQVNQQHMVNMVKLPRMAADMTRVVLAELMALLKVTAQGRATAMHMAQD